MKRNELEKLLKEYKNALIMAENADAYDEWDKQFEIKRTIKRLENELATMKKQNKRVIAGRGNNNNKNRNGE